MTCHSAGSLDSLGQRFMRINRVVIDCASKTPDGMIKADATSSLYLRSAKIRNGDFRRSFSWRGHQTFKPVIDIIVHKPADRKHFLRKGTA